MWLSRERITNDLRKIAGSDGIMFGSVIRVYTERVTGV